MPVSLRSVDQISYAVKDIDAAIKAWSHIYGMGPWTFAENGGLDVKGRPWKIRMAFTYIGAMQMEFVQCIEGRIFQSYYHSTCGGNTTAAAKFFDEPDIPPLRGA